MTEDFTDPDEYQQDAIDALDRRSGFNPNPLKSKSKPKKRNQSHRSKDGIDGRMAQTCKKEI